MTTPWERFKQAARLEEPEGIMLLDVGVRESPEVVAGWAKICLNEAARAGG